jgi:hypothetical protein
MAYDRLIAGAKLVYVKAAVLAIFIAGLFRRPRG